MLRPICKPRIRTTDTGVCEKDAPPEKNANQKKGFQSTKSGAGERIQPLHSKTQTCFVVLFLSTKQVVLLFVVLFLSTNQVVVLFVVLFLSTKQVVALFFVLQFQYVVFVHRDRHS